jgi:hypothetical protein
MSSSDLHELATAHPQIWIRPAAVCTCSIVCKGLTVILSCRGHRNQSIKRKGAYILADVLAMDNSTLDAATRLFLWSNINKGDKKFYLLKKLYITKPYHGHMSVYYRDSSLKLIIWIVALVSDRSGPCRGCLLIYRP